MGQIISDMVTRVHGTFLSVMKYSGAARYLVAPGTNLNNITPRPGKYQHSPKWKLVVGSQCRNPKLVLLQSWRACWTSVSVDVLVNMPLEYICTSQGTSTSTAGTVKRGNLMTEVMMPWVKEAGLSFTCTGCTESPRASPTGQSPL